MTTFDELANPWIKGLSIYEPGRPIEEVARELGFEDASGIIKLASNENALGPSPLALEAMRAHAERMHRYPDGGGFYLKQGLATALGVADTNILCGNGSNEILELLGHVFLAPGAGIVMADKAFVVYRLVAMAERAAIEAVPMRALTHDLDAMLAAITPDTRLVFIGNPNNPTGTMVDAAAIDEFMARVPEHVVVCFDEAYIELVDPRSCPDTLPYVREGRNVVIVRTFSKAYGLAGLRIGYAVAPRECIALLDRVRQPFNVNAMAQAAALAALNDTAHVARTRAMVAEGLRYLETECERLGLDYVRSVANFMLIKVGQGRAVFHQLQKSGVIVRAMDGYGLPEYVRVTIGTQRENRMCVAALADAVK